MPRRFLTGWRGRWPGRSWPILCVLGVSLGLGAPARAADPACSDLVGMIDAAPPGPVFLASYPTVASGPLHGAAFLYDNAAAAIALIGCGETAKARRIGDAMLIALDHDRFWHDGRLRNGYAAGAVDPSAPARMAGWWDAKAGRWLEDAYQAGSDSGNMAWAMLALLALDRAGAGPAYRLGAERVGHWVAQWRDPRGAGGFTGGTFGHEPAPEVVGWKSTEHNTDLAAAFAALAARAGDAAGRTYWRALADWAGGFVAAQWNAADARFAAGTGPDGVASNPILALDAQVWPLLALPGAVARFGAATATVQRVLGVADGLAYSDRGAGVWTEGTAQMALLAVLLGRKDEARALDRAVAARRAPQGGYYATDSDALATGFDLPTVPGQPRLYYRMVHLGATAWAALAQRHFNPFTATTGLPGGLTGTEGSR